MRVVIVGGGFGGIKAALELAGHEGVEISLISDRTTFDYHAALYRSATGRSPREVAVPLRDIFPGGSGVEVILDKATNIDFDSKTIKGESGRRYDYDFAVLALGQVSNRFNLPGLDQAFSIDTLSSTIKLRRHLHDVVLQASTASHKFVVVGGGASGTELAAELGFYIEDLCRRHGKSNKDVEVTLVEAGPRLLTLLDSSVSTWAAKRLKKLGVKVILNARVAKLTGGYLDLGKRKIKTDTVIWAAGFKNNPFFALQKGLFSLAPSSRVKVDEHLRAAHSVYVIGDNADTQFAGMAQTALADAKYVAQDIVARLNNQKRPSYKAHRPIYVVPAGGKYALLQWGSLRLRGLMAWWLRRLADLRLFINFEPLAKAVYTWRQANQLSRPDCELCSPKKSS